jgi:hypothetical protein
MKGRQGHPNDPRMSVAVAGLGDLSSRRTDSKRSVRECPKGRGDGMTTQQVLSEGGDGPRWRRGVA